MQLLDQLAVTVILVQLLLQVAAQVEYGIQQHPDVQAVQVEAGEIQVVTAVDLEYRAGLDSPDKAFQADRVYVSTTTVKIHTTVVVVVAQAAFKTAEHFQ